MVVKTLPFDAAEYLTDEESIARMKGRPREPEREIAIGQRAAGAR